MQTTSTLADYAAERGYTDPRIGRAWIIDRWVSFATATGQQPSFERIVALKRQGAWRVEITFAEGAIADFTVNELLPMVGISAHGEIRSL